MAPLLPGGGVARIIFIFVLFGWTGVSRLGRSQVLSLRQQDLVEAARALGASELRIMLRHLVPNAMAPIIVATTLAVGGFILGESALSYLGLGIQPPTPSWGNMLQRAQEYVLNASWLGLFSRGLLFLTVLRVKRWTLRRGWLALLAALGAATLAGPVTAAPGGRDTVVIGMAQEPDRLGGLSILVGAAVGVAAAVA